MDCYRCDYCGTDDSYWGDISEAKCCKTGYDVIVYLIEGAEGSPEWCPLRRSNVNGQEASSK